MKHIIGIGLVIVIIIISLYHTIRHYPDITNAYSDKIKYIKNQYKHSFIRKHFDNDTATAGHQKLNCLANEKSMQNGKHRITYSDTYKHWMNSENAHILWDNFTIHLISDHCNHRLDSIHNNSGHLKKMQLPLMKASSSIPDVYAKYFTSHPELPRLLDFALYSANVRLLGSVSRLLIKNGISFIIGAGTLLGSFLNHDLLPYDDDLDIFVDIYHLDDLLVLFNQQEVKSVYKLFGWSQHKKEIEINKLSLPLDSKLIDLCKAPKINPKCIYKYKIVFKTAKRTTQYPWPYPFVDIFFTINNGTHVYHVEEKLFVYKKDDFYPTVMRPYNSYWMPGPRNPEMMLKARYNVDICRRGGWDHQHEKGQTSKQVACDRLETHYPTVIRLPLKEEVGSNTTANSYYPIIEVLIVDKMLLHIVLIN